MSKHHAAVNNSCSANFFVYSLLKVRVNEYDARGFNPPELSRHQEYTVVRYSAHPRYKSGRFLNDIAILHLEKSIDLLSHNGINAACKVYLPLKKEIQMLEYDAAPTHIW